MLKIPEREEKTKLNPFQAGLGKDLSENPGSSHPSEPNGRINARGQYFLNGAR